MQISDLLFKKQVSLIRKCHILSHSMTFLTFNFVTKPLCSGKNFVKYEYPQSKSKRSWHLNGQINTLNSLLSFTPHPKANCCAKYNHQIKKEEFPLRAAVTDRWMEG